MRDLDTKWHRSGVLAVKAAAWPLSAGGLAGVDKNGSCTWKTKTLKDRCSLPVINLTCVIKYFSLKVRQPHWPPCLSVTFGYVPFRGRTSSRVWSQGKSVGPAEWLTKYFLALPPPDTFHGNNFFCCHDPFCCCLMSLRWKMRKQTSTPSTSNS